MTKTRLVIPLDAIQDDDGDVVGGKAAGLARLSHIGLSIPPGFCVTGRAYRGHIDSPDVMRQLTSAVGELENARHEKAQQALSRIRNTIIDAPMASELVARIEKYYAQLGSERLAVRSSATAEDLCGHSFAGLYDTFLGVAGLTACIEAIKKCWASLWTQRAYDYRRKNGFDHLAVDMAVVVQSLLAAEASGVIFTADPVTGRTDRIVIEATFGLGDLLVSGKVIPDRFVIDKNRVKIISRTLSEKKIVSVSNDAGVHEQATAPERMSAACIDDAQAVKLARLARKAEARLGRPQDMEWATWGKRIFLLQSRPITTGQKEKSWEDRQVWSNMMAQEVMPDVATPATLSVIQSLAEDLFDPLFRVLCTERSNHPLYGVLAGRLYFNLNLWIAVIRALPGVNKYDFSEDAGSEPGLRKIIEIEKTLTDDDLPNLKLKRLRFLVKIPLLILSSLAATPKKGRSFIAHLKTQNQKWQSLDRTALSNQQLVEICPGILTDFHAILANGLYLFNAMGAFFALEAVCSRWLPAEQQCAKRLLAGLGDMEDAASGLDLWRLALVADSNPQVRDIMLSGDDWHTLSHRLPQTEPGHKFLADWNAFMDRHGFHCRAELELYNARWSETPDYILGLVRSYIGSISTTDPLESQRKLAARREDLTRKCRKTLRNPVKRLLFNHLLFRSQQGALFRENIKCEAVKLLTAMRNTLLELGGRLAAESVLERPDDIFFLKIEELEPVTQAKPGFDVAATVAARRAEYDHWKSVTPPGTIVGRFDPNKAAHAPVDTDTEVFIGLAVSPGVVTGKARVILRADTNEQIASGEILVAPFTDPGWTPYFVPAAAIVMDQGSILSHGSIIAREYGIPGVVNVGVATKIIRTGQTIRVDGDRGVVKILKEPGDSR
jgi:phosphohistidine swiveling domain-containing protein